jgi:pimeloyl-ACP methyl ester carboxylesterase
MRKYDFCARFFITFVVAVLLLAASVSPGLSASTTPDQDPFYFDAAPRLDAEPGDIINVRKSIFTMDPLLQIPHPGVNSWQIIYQSINATGQPIAVSGTVIVPTASWPDGRRPIISYAVGTRGIGDACAPSFTLSQGNDYEAQFIANLLSQGWAVAISDYEGLGTPEIHTYMVGHSQGRVVLDMARAAQRLPEAGLSAEAPVGLIGYSQGGASTGWAAQLAGSYAPELNIVGAAAGGVPADLERVGEFLDGSLFVAFALMTSVGFDTAYDDLVLEDYLNARGRDLREESGEICMTAVEAFQNLTNISYTHYEDYTTINPLDTALWQTRLGEQRLGRLVPEMPVFLYQAQNDSVIPLDQAAKLRQDWCRLGATVDWLTFIGNHQSALPTGFPRLIKWMEARFKGLSTLGGCGAFKNALKAAL